jgi:hypothetical protein
MTFLSHCNRSAPLEGSKKALLGAGNSRPVTPGAQEPIGDGDLGAFLGDQRPGGEVEGKARPTKDRQHDKGDSNVRDVEGEERGEASSNTTQFPVIDGTAEALGTSLIRLVGLDDHD